MAQSIFISIIIPCLNEERYVGKLLDDIYNQINLDFEVIAVDNRSDDKTLEVLNRYKDRGLIVVKDIKRGVSRARNAGADLASGHWLLFLDADNRLKHNCLKTLLSELKSSDDFAIGTLNYRAEGYNMFYRFYFFMSKWYQKLSTWFGFPHATGVGTVVKKRTHFLIGGYDETITYGEDLVYARTAKLKGAKFKHLKAVSIVSVRRLRNYGWLKQLGLYGRYVAAKLRRKDYLEDDSYDFINHKMK